MDNNFYCLVTKARKSNSGHIVTKKSHRHFLTPVQLLQIEQNVTYTGLTTRKLGVISYSTAFCYLMH